MPHEDAPEADASSLDPDRAVGAQSLLPTGRDLVRPKVIEGTTIPLSNAVEAGGAISLSSCSGTWSTSLYVSSGLLDDAGNVLLKSQFSYNAGTQHDPAGCAMDYSATYSQAALAKYPSATALRISGVSPDSSDVSVSMSFPRRNW